VLVNYPLKIKLGKEELFHLTKFDFFYPTKFKQVLDVAMIYPLQWDQKFVDFSYDDTSLKADYFEYNNSIDVKENCLPNDAGYFTCKRKTLKDALPFGPFIVAGVTLVFFFGYHIINGYFYLFNLY